MNRAVIVRIAPAVLLLVLCLSSVDKGHSQDPTDASVAQPDVRDPVSQRDEMVEMLPEELKPKDFGAGDITAANTVVQSLNIVDWMGPLAPLALSPFFGLTCLSGLAIWGPDWLSGNALLSSAGPLKNPYVFGVFVLLTVLTSVPRLTKVSKPFAQAMDQVESYSVILILLVVKLLADFGNDPSPEPVAMVQFGVFSFTAQTLLAMAMVVNLIVINSVKFFFEVLIWLTPIPAVDAMFEITNKAICAGLMALYAFSPTIATVINLAMFLAAMIVFRWIHRRMTFYRGMLTDLFLSRVWKSYGRPSGASFVAFVKKGDAPFNAKSRWRLTRDDDKWIASQVGLFGKEQKTLSVLEPPRLCCGWIMHTINFKMSDGALLEFHVSRRFDQAMDEWVEQCRFEIGEMENEVVESVESARAEFA